MKMADEDKVIVWAKNRSSHVTPISSILWRVKDATKFGQTFRGPDGEGSLHELAWNTVLDHFPPSLLEITGAPNPITSLLNALRSIDDEKVGSFFGRLRLVYLSGSTGLDSADLGFLVDHASQIAGFGCNDLDYIDDDITELLKKLSGKQLTSLALNSDMGPQQLARWLTDLRGLQMVQLSGSPGLKAKTIETAGVQCESVSFLAAQELNFVSDDDAATLLKAIPARFPKLQCLYFDWNIVDPELIYDTKTKETCDALESTFKALPMLWLAIMAYTPTRETVDAAQKVVELFSAEKKMACRMLRFRSRGLTQGEDNFALIIIGEMGEERAMRLTEVIVDERNSAPDLRHFLYVINGHVDDGLRHPDATFEFGGFDRAEIQSKFSQISSSHQMFSDHLDQIS